MEFRGIMGGFYRISEWIMRLSVINVLWVIFSIPFFYLLLVTIVMPEMTVDLLKQSLLLLGIVAPFTLVPASAAMFAVARKWVTGEEDVPLFKTFLRSYKENYRQSMLGGFLFLLIGGILYVNYQFYLTQSGTLRWLSLLFLSFGVVLIAAFINFLSIMVHFHMKLFQILKNAFIMTLGQPITAIAILATNGFILYISTRFTFLIPFFMGSLCAISSFWYFNRGFIKIQSKAEAYREKQAALESEQTGSAEDMNNSIEDVQTKK